MNEDLVPARMLNEYVYCPRLAFVEWVGGEFRDNHYTKHGRFEHRRVDRKSSRTESREWEQIHHRSLDLSAVKAGIIAKIDVAEQQGGSCAPVEYKRGKPPDIEHRVYEPERVQVCAQAIVLEENGFECVEGWIYFTGSRERVRVELTEDLRSRTLDAANELRGLAQTRECPPPLLDSPKCNGCSLVGICLPDETNHLKCGSSPPRRIVPRLDEKVPLHVQHQGARIGTRGDELTIKAHDLDERKVRLREISSVRLYGNVQLTTQAIRKLCNAGVPVTFASYGGWFYGLLGSLQYSNVDLRKQQYTLAERGDARLAIAKSLIAQKIRNQRVFLRRNLQGEKEVELRELKILASNVENARSIDQILGLEGTAARIYFKRFNDLIRSNDVDFDMDGRNRRPPKDPINALLSLAYSLLLKDWVIVLSAIGFDPHMGFLHRPKPGKPALALDMIEPFRVLVADSVVIGSVNNGVVQAKDFVRALGSTSLSSNGRKKFIAAYEKRMADQITHPVFGYRISYRRTLEVQGRLAARYLMEEIPEFPVFVTR